ncbi:hypothetical protein CPB84DRAFT_1797232, partial [Gymnopilus junonius]
MIEMTSQLHGKEPRKTPPGKISSKCRSWTQMTNRSTVACGGLERHQEVQVRG